MNLKELRKQSKKTAAEVAEVWIGVGKNMKIQNNLAVLMAMRKIKISKLSQLTGISRATLTSIYYNKEKGITYAVLEKICDALECQVKDVLIIATQ